MQNFVQNGDKLTLVAPYVVASGGGVKVGYIFGVAIGDVASGNSGDFMVRGVFDLTKDASTFATGDSVYWDNTHKVCTSNSSGSLLIGVAALSQPSGTDALGGVTGDATVRVRLNGTFL
jgi:predicted RecA/RadA family phage recombinase